MKRATIVDQGPSALVFPFRHRYPGQLARHDGGRVRLPARLVSSSPVPPIRGPT